MHEFPLGPTAVCGQRRVPHQPAEGAHRGVAAERLRSLRPDFWRLRRKVAPSAPMSMPTRSDTTQRGRGSFLGPLAHGPRNFLRPHFLDCHRDCGILGDIWAHPLRFQHQFEKAVAGRGSPATLVASARMHTAWAEAAEAHGAWQARRLHCIGACSPTALHCQTLPATFSPCTKTSPEAAEVAMRPSAVAHIDGGVAHRPAGRPTRSAEAKRAERACGADGTIAQASPRLECGRLQRPYTPAGAAHTPPAAPPNLPVGASAPVGPASGPAATAWQRGGGMPPPAAPPLRTRRRTCPSAKAIGPSHEARRQPPPPKDTVDTGPTTTTRATTCVGTCGESDTCRRPPGPGSKSLGRWRPWPHTSSGPAWPTAPCHSC